MRVCVWVQAGHSHTGSLSHLRLSLPASAAQAGKLASCACGGGTFCSKPLKRKREPELLLGHANEIDFVDHACHSARPRRKK